MLSVEEVALAVGQKIGHSSVKSAARMNRVVVLFLEKVEQVNKLVETGITVGGQFVQVTPLTQPAARITLSNVPLFISDEFLVKELSRHGKVVSPIRKMLLGSPPAPRPVLAARHQWSGAKGGPAVLDGVVVESHAEEKQSKCMSETEVSGGSEMVVEMNGESGEAGGKETHSDRGIEADWEKEWEGQALLSHNTTLSGGVGLLFSRGFTPSFLEVEYVLRGRCLLLKAHLQNHSLVFINIYAPTIESVLDHDHAEPHPASQHCLRQLAYSHGLVDV
ncbi:hypothetical protein D4764_14G0005010 [Takifugu flavidus]|uniref:Uncharacterized protein n=1 Tax=Takifugu flavidus TaxID=433684 RepID=A0A5C6P6I5_9TELE|nr:hypothetical protein D4764_14G0005010 [Takifugu flavidus]